MAWFRTRQDEWQEHATLLTSYSTTDNSIGLFYPNLIKIQSLIAPGLVMSRIKKDQILFRLILP